MTSPIQPNGRLTIDLSAITDNWKFLGRNASHGQCGAVVKADGYGLGLSQVTNALNKAGCREFFVATLEEAKEARAASGEATVYTLDGYHHAAHKTYRDHQITPLIVTPEQLNHWVSNRQDGMAAGLHIDTGINRMGLSCNDVADLPDGIDPTLVISHFACADDQADPMNDAQIARFIEATLPFPNARKSMANSAGVFLGSKAHFDLLRPGVALYGGEAVNNVGNPMKPVVRLQGRVLQIRTAKAGQTVGYGATAKLTRDTKIGVVGIGYADGLHRAASGSGTLLRNNRIGEGGCVMLGEHKAPFLGRVFHGHDLH